MNYLLYQKRNQLITTSDYLTSLAELGQVYFAFCFWNVNFFFLSTVILAMGGWLNSFLLFNSSCFFLLEILTASLACLVSGSLYLLVISILILISSPSWSLLLCLNRALSPLPFLNWLRCSAALVLAERAVSPSYTLSSPLSSQVSQISLYPTWSRGF